MDAKNIIIIGSGFAGLSAAASLAREGHKVTVLEKNTWTGGRAGVWKKDGFTFDMGPSWYWMPGIFEEYFAKFGKKVSDYYTLKRLDPSYRIFFTGKEEMDVPAMMTDLLQAFENREAGSAEKLKVFLEDAKLKYETAMTGYVNKVSDSFTEFLEPGLIKKALKMDILSSMRKTVRKKFKDPLLVSLLEFPVLFLGATPSDTPALYSLMNYADLVLGTWYPMGGMGEIAKAFTSLAEEQGAIIKTGTEVKRIEHINSKASKIHTAEKVYDADIVIAAADYHHVEQELLEKDERRYDEKYWDKRVMAPSSLLYYIGIDTKLEGILHHNLFFDEDMDAHAEEIYKKPAWPLKPLFYLCASSITDESCAPPGNENLFFLMPLAPGLEDSEKLREEYLDMMLNRLKKRTGIDIRPNIVVKRSYAMKDFLKDHNAYKGNAYGLANTLMQTAWMKPKMKAKAKNMFYCGQLTVPGPGVPPSIISGQIVAEEIIKQINNKKI